MTLLVAAAVKILVIVGFLFNLGALLTWVDRRQSSMMQDRVGPNRAVLKIGSFELRAAGLLHTAADGLKFFFKEDFMPPKADKLLFALAPILSLGAVLALVVVMPMTGTLCLDQIMDVVPATGAVCEESIAGSVAPLNVGLLYVFAIAGQGAVSAAIAGWASDNKFSIMGGIRAASQMVSYEVALGLSLVGMMMVYGTVRPDEMVIWQQQNTWGVFVQPLAFVLFFVSAVAETKRIPFDLPEAESELVAGYMTEYPGMKFGMFYFSEYMEVATSSMLIATIFLGGYSMPFMQPNGITIAFGQEILFQQELPHVVMIALGVLVFFGKVVALCHFQCFVRWGLPRFRYDQLMRLGWRILLPLALVNILATGVVLLAVDSASASVVSALGYLAQLTQMLVAGAILYGVARFVIFFFGRHEKATVLVGSSAAQAAEQGGTPHSSMQA